MFTRRLGRGVSDRSSKFDDRGRAVASFGRQIPVIEGRSAAFPRSHRLLYGTGESTLRWRFPTLPNACVCVRHPEARMER